MFAEHTRIVCVIGVDAALVGKAAAFFDQYLGFSHFCFNSKNTFSSVGQLLLRFDVGAKSCINIKPLNAVVTGVDVTRGQDVIMRKNGAVMLNVFNNDRRSEPFLGCDFNVAIGYKDDSSFEATLVSFAQHLFNGLKE